MARTDVLFVADLDEKGVISKAQNLERGMDDLRQTTEKTDSVFKQLTKSFVAANIIYDGVRRAARALTDEFKSTIAFAAKQEEVEKSLAAALAITGRSIPLASFKEFASSLQSATRFGDEEILSAQALLVQMTKLDEGGLKRAMKGAIGLASVMRMDLFSATQLIQKALEGNYGALSRYGIRIDETLSAEEKQAQLLEILTTLYGRAEAEADTYAVKVTQLKNAYNDLKEKIGDFIIKNKEVLTILNDTKTVLEWITDLTGKLPKNLPTFNIGNLEGFVGKYKMAFHLFASFLRENKRLTDEAAQAYRDANDEAGALCDTFIKRVISSGTEVNVVMRQMALKTIDAAAAFDTMADASVGKLASWIQLEDTLRSLSEIDISGAVERMFPGEETADVGTPPFLQNLIDAANEGQKKFKSMEKTWHTTMTRMEYYSDQFFDNITTGFTNAFMNFSLSVAGFKDFFISTWNAIKRAFFQIIGDMLARWAVMSFVKMLFPLQTLVPSFVGGILPGGPILAQHGYSGVVTQPTMFIAGESAPERVNIQPIGHAGGGGERPVSIAFNINAIDASGVEKFLRHDAYPTLRAMFAHGDL